MDNEANRHYDIERMLEEELKLSLVDGKLPCVNALKISRKFMISPEKISAMANKLDVKISNCQLGCFK